jgi:hypothetical protein
VTRTLQFLFLAGKATAGHSHRPIDAPPRLPPSRACEIPTCTARIFRGKWPIVSYCPS